LGFIFTPARPEGIPHAPPPIPGLHIGETVKNDFNIVRAIEDPKLFGPLFKNQASFGNWKAMLKAIFGLSMDKKETGIYKEYTGRTDIPKEQFKEIFAIIGRRGGKSFISAIVAAYLAVFHDWKQYLVPGELGWIMCIASDRRQAQVVMGYIKAIFRLKSFAGMVEVAVKEEIRLKNQVAISVKTSDFRTLRGFSILAAICDEVAFWRDENSCNPAKEILTALRPGLATMPGSMLINISSPYSKSGPLYESFRDLYGTDDPDVLVIKAPSKAMNPTLPDRVIDKALKDDYAAAKAEWLAEFRDDLEAYLSPEIIDASIVPGRYALPRLDETEYFAFTDPSGGRGDSFTLAICHQEYRNKEDEEDEEIKIVLDRLEEMRPPFNPRECVSAIAQILRKYNIEEVTGDAYAGEWVTRSFEDEDIYYRNSDLSKSEIYIEFLPLLMQRSVELLDNARLAGQLKSLERRTRSGGRDIVDHPRGLHDDCANVCAGACVLAGEIYQRPEIIVLG